MHELRRQIAKRWAAILQRTKVRRRLLEHYRKAETREGRQTVCEAISLQRNYPDLSSGELLRLAYWGASGVTSTD